MKRVYLKVNDTDFYYCVYKYKNRIIYNPCENLRHQQKIILNFIKMMYKIKLNTKNAAIVHCKRKWILKTDIKSFYDSFSKEQLDRAIHHLCLDLATVCTLNEQTVYDICTLNDKLPTGALTSAHIANYAFKLMKIDEVICEFCRQNEINYSRYMDDLTFSADKKSKLNEAEKFVVNMLAVNGFSLNREKTKYISDNKKQEVLGILVNNKQVTFSHFKKSQFRAMIFNYLKSLNIEERLGTATLFERKITLEKIMGYFAYIKSCDEKYYEKAKEYLASKINKFDLSRHEEIEKLVKVLNLKCLQMKLL